VTVDNLVVRYHRAPKLRECLLESINGVTPFRCGRFANGILIPEETSLLDRLLERDGLNPMDRHEALALTWIIGEGSVAGAGINDV
jgi:hypothetical protein